mmetsp:Transcript_30820/g.72679  ORF Transcript_30820/g.72679 Transcript_30820/m.72679 type:complete len:116 (-) Transcript_30820:1018-1365(-)
MKTENGFTQDSTAVGTSGAILTQQSYILPLRCLGHRTARVTLFYPDPDPVPVRYSTAFPPKPHHLAALEFQFAALVTAGACSRPSVGVSPVVWGRRLLPPSATPVGPVLGLSLCW